MTEFLFRAIGDGRPLAPTAVIVVLLACRGWATEPKPDATGQETAAARLVRMAQESEVAGRDDQREALLRQAMVESPDDAAAHWQLGHVQMDKKWQSPADVEQAAKQDKRLAEYVRRRDAARPVIDDQISLARWCRQNRLTDEAQVAWRSVLAVQPGHPDAINALGLVAHEGQWLTRAEIKRQKTRLKAMAAALDRWRPIVIGWRLATQNGRDADIEEVLKTVASISDAGEMLAVERILWQQVGSRREYQKTYQAMVKALIAALKESPQQPATESLARHAVFARSKEVRQAAVAALKAKRPEGYAPLLLTGMATPVEFSAQVDIGAGGHAISRFSVFREGPVVNQRYTWGDSPVLSEDSMLLLDWAGAAALQQFAAGLEYRPFPGNVVAPTLAELQADQQNRRDIDRWNQNVANLKTAASGNTVGNQVALRRTGEARVAAATAAAASISGTIQDAAAMQAEVERFNRAIAGQNAKIAAVLAETTGKDFGDDPIAWWEWWWKQYNEIAISTAAASPSPGDSQSAGAPSPSSPSDSGDSGASSRPQQEYDNFRYPRAGIYLSPSGGYALNTPPPDTTRVISPSFCSCLARGSLVWTQRGPAPIEQIVPGDRVLAVDIGTGELAYKPVLRVTVRPPSARIRVGLGTESVTVTPGHAFWVVGRGWRMAKQLAVGDRLHTPGGSLIVESLQKVPATEVPRVTSHNLVVADFNTFFVASRGILVHDILPAEPMTVALPGMRPGTAATAP